MVIMPGAPDIIVCRVTKKLIQFRKKRGGVQSPLSKFELLTVMNNIHPSASVDISGCKINIIYKKLSIFICYIDIDTG